MPRQTNPVASFDFKKALITETTELGFPDNAVAETFNCVFDRTGFVKRRAGFDFETGYSTTLAYTPESGEVFTEFVWNAVAGDGTISFFVQQKANIVYFYDISTADTLSTNRKTATLNLDTFLPSGSGLDPSQYPLQYASGRGILTMVSRAIKPTLVQYNTSSGLFSTTSYELQTRDFTGIDDGMALSFRPTSTVAAIKSSSPEHYYNLLNQGWGEVAGAALSAWDTARADLPSKADYIALYRSSPTVIFDNNRVLNQDPLNTPAATGHFILTVSNPDRTAAMVADGFAGASITNPSIIIAPATGSLLNSGWVNASFGGPPTVAFDGVTSAPFGANAIIAPDAASFIGKNYTSSPKQISQCIIYGTTNNGYFLGGNPTITYTLYAKQSAPSNKTDGTVLGTLAFADVTDGSGGKILTSADTTTFWNYVWVGQDQAGSVNTGPILVEIEFYSPGTNPSTVPTTVERPRTVCFFAGRLFYAGLEAFSLNNTIFFTQILQQESQYGQCYQLNDPTNENIFNLLPSDGGTITIPDMGSVRKLFAYQNALLILASNGIWMVTGGSSGGFGGGFQANDYFVKKLSSVGTNAPQSVVDHRGVPMWWGEDGIYTIQYDPNFNSFNVINVTFKTIRSFFLDIPQANRVYAKGAYDPTLDIIYWVYNSDDSPADNWTYNAVLAYSGITNAFYPWTIDDTSVPAIRGIVAIQDAARNNLTSIKYTTTINGPTIHSLLYSEANDETNWTDWFTVSPVDYLSYFITAFRVDAAGQRFGQANYLWVFEEMIPNASCFVQGLFDFSSTGNSGKWSTPQQVCKFFDGDFGLNFKRLKIRGKGRGLQLRFKSESGKPFQIQGWSMWESITGAP